MLPRNIATTAKKASELAPIRNPKEYWLDMFSLVKPNDAIGR